MKHSVFVLFLAVFVFFSCKKQSDPTIPPPFYPPNDTTSHTAIPMPILLDVPNGSYLYNTWGRLIAMISDSTRVLAAGDTVHTGSQYGIAFFVDSNVMNNLDAGTISLNNINIPHPTGYFSYKGITELLTVGASWIVSGSSVVPGISYTYSGGFPQYTGTLPYAVTKAAGIKLTFNAATVSNADSVCVVLTVVDSNSSVTYYGTFSATAGAITITGSQFNYLPSADIQHGYLTLMPFKYTTAAFGHKKFVFVKQAEISHSVSLQ